MVMHTVPYSTVHAPHEIVQSADDEVESHPADRTTYHGKYSNTVQHL